MKERPILMSGPMVTALLEGRKGQTRRLLKPQPYECDAEWVTDYEKADGDPVLVTDKSFLQTCLHGQPGDRLWVKETYALLAASHHQNVCAYRASCPGDEFDFVHDSGAVERLRVKRWRPSLFMSRGLSRITLEITEVRVQRLQDISEEDAKAEGVEWTGGGDFTLSSGGWRNYGQQDFAGEQVSYFLSARESYASLWDSLNGKKPGASWADNPHVWAIAFRRVEAGHG